jgi:septation ring formation regulator EzrA
MATVEEFIAIGAGALIIMSIGLGAFGLSLQSIANPIKTFSDSFSKLIDNINTDNLSKMKDGVVAVKEAMTELRGELRKFNKDDLSVLDKLGNLTTNVSTATETVKKNNYADLTNAIVTAIRTGMSNIQITVESDGTIKRNFREENKTVSRPGF